MNKLQYTKSNKAMAEIKMCQIKSSATGELIPINCDVWKREYQFKMDSHGNPLYEYAGQINVAVTDDSPYEKKTAVGAKKQVRTSGCGCKK